MPTKIPYLDDVWNMMGGCSPCSEGCQNCFAARLASGRLRHHPLYQGLAKGGKWTGEVRLCREGDILAQPFHWRKPRRIGVQFMGDLFHKNVPFWFIDRVFTIMALCWGNNAYKRNSYPNHIFQILTKRPDRMAEYMSGNVKARWGTGAPCVGPLKNVRLGVSCENQDRLNERLGFLVQIPAAHRFVSLEPLLGPIKLQMYPEITSYEAEAFSTYGCPSSFRPQLDWVVVGCESGPKRRPCNIEWVRDIVNQCKDAGVSCFVKQLSINGKVSRNMAEWPEDLQVQEKPK